MALMQLVRNQGGMKGLLQPAVQAEGMQRLAVMLALMVMVSPPRCTDAILGRTGDVEDNFLTIPGRVS